jgi:hypothetical protein
MRLAHFYSLFLRNYECLLLDRPVYAGLRAGPILLFFTELFLIGWCSVMALTIRNGRPPTKAAPIPINPDGFAGCSGVVNLSWLNHDRLAFAEKVPLASACHVQCAAQHAVDLARVEVKEA